MTVLRFQSDSGSLCEVNIAEPNLPKSIIAQMDVPVEVWFKVDGMELDENESDIRNPELKPLFFEQQKLDWIFQPNDESNINGPYKLYVNGAIEKKLRYRKFRGGHQLVGSVNLGNAVGKTRFEIKDAKGKNIFELGVEVFPQKLDYKDDFPAMISEITEIVYSLAFDLFKKTYASAKTRATSHQSYSEWLKLYMVLAENFEKSIDAIIRAPKSELKREHRIKQVDRVKKASHRSVINALKNPSRYCRGGGLSIIPSVKISHLQEEHKLITYDTRENQFVAWAIRDVIKKLSFLIKSLEKQKGLDEKRVAEEKDLLRGYQRKLRFRLLDPALADVSRFKHQQQFSTTLTMAPGYKEFYHRYLLLRKGLSLGESDLFSMDYKDIATLYEYWCFLKTVKLLRDNPKYDLTSSDIVKIEHNKFSVNLKKGVKSKVSYMQRSTGDEISLYYNHVFSRDEYTHTFSQIPDNFIEFSRTGYGNKKDEKTFKVVFDAKYRFDRGSPDYPDTKLPYGPPLDTIAQLHRYRDAILWQEDVDDTVRVANKSLGGVILFPYPNDEMEFKKHPFYESIEKVNIGAVPLQPGIHRENQLYKDYLDSLFEQSGEEINERRIRYDARQYTDKKKSQSDLVMIGMIPKANRKARLDYHFSMRTFYTQWNKEPMFPLERVSIVALYDQQTTSIIGWAQVESIEFMLGKELKHTGTTWPARKPNDKHCVYNLGEINEVNLYAGSQMSGQRHGRFFVSRLGLELALEHNNSDLLYMNTWEKYQKWKELTTQFENVKVNRATKSAASGADISELTFTPV